MMSVYQLELQGITSVQFRLLLDIGAFPAGVVRTGHVPDHGIYFFIYLFTCIYYGVREGIH